MYTTTQSDCEADLLFSRELAEQSSNSQTGGSRLKLFVSISVALCLALGMTVWITSSGPTRQTSTERTGFLKVKDDDVSPSEEVHNLDGAVMLEDGDGHDDDDSNWETDSSVNVYTATPAAEAGDKETPSAVRAIQEKTEDVPELLEEKKAEEPKAAFASSPGGKPYAEFVFVTKTNEEKIIKAEYQPPGLLFDKRLPIIITAIKPGSYGEKLGVEEGWTMKSVNGDLLMPPDCTEFPRALEIIHKHIENLPVYKP